jgi:hypothetical protein
MAYTLPQEASIFKGDTSEADEDLALSIASNFRSLHFQLPSASGH